MPEISITGAFGVNPAARAADFSSLATAAGAASPTSPQRSQIRNTTSSPLRVIVDAGDEGVAALDAMDEAVLAQKIERTVDRDRRGPCAGGRRAVDDLVGAERLVALEQNLQHLATDRRQPLRALRAQRSACVSASAVQRSWSWPGAWKTGCDIRFAWRNAAWRTSSADFSNCKRSAGSRKSDASQQVYVAMQQYKPHLQQASGPRTRLARLRVCRGNSNA